MNAVMYLYALKMCGYNQSAAAKYLGVTRAAVWQFLKTHSTGRVYIIHETQDYYQIDDVTEGKPATGKCNLSALGTTLQKLIAKYPNATFVWPDKTKTRWNQKTRRWKKTK